MIDYTGILKTYGAQGGKLKCILLSFINESIDATVLVYKYLDAVNRRTILRYMYRRKLVRRYGMFIDPEARIDSGLRLPHPHSIVVGAGVFIGNNVTLYQEVTVGSSNIGKREYPEIKNGAVIFSGAKIFGKITIEENAIIGANSVINRNVEKNTTYAGIPGRKIV